MMILTGIIIHMYMYEQAHALTGSLLGLKTSPTITDSHYYRITDTFLWYQHNSFIVLTLNKVDTLNISY